MRRLLTAAVIGLFAAAVFFFFVTPGIFFRGIRNIPPDAPIVITRIVYERAPIEGTMIEVFDMTYSAEYWLNAEQAAALRSFLRSTVFTRPLFSQTGGMIFFHPPLDMHSYTKYRINVTGTHEQPGWLLTINILGGRFVSGSPGHFPDRWLRISSPRWEENLLYILRMAAR